MATYKQVDEAYRKEASVKEPAEGVTLSGVERHETVCGHNSGESRITGAEGVRKFIFPISQAKGQGSVMVTP
jgi:hypothetical protein